MSFSTLGLSADLLRAIAERGYAQPSPVQAEAIPVVLEGRDLLAGAQTGTGKTAAFTLPLLQRLQASAKPRARHTTRALILVPTRELAAQVSDSVRTYGKYLPLKSAVVFGGVNMGQQIRALSAGVDVLVATPGRLLDHVQQRTVDLSKVEILVLDEADRMLDMGFIRDIRKILALLPTVRQNLLFSATFSDEIKQLTDGMMKAPAYVQVAARNATADSVEQSVYLVDKARKRELLAHLISTNNWQQVLVFGRTKHGATRLAEQLDRDGLPAAAIHGNKSQSQRTRALADFKQGRVRVLVATDIAARGIDIDQLPHVVNFELPNVPEDYVHRIGRTGRAGNTGEAISLVCGEERKLLADIQRLLKRELPRREVDGFAMTERGTSTLPARTGGERRARPEGQRQQRPAGNRPTSARGNANRADREQSFGRDRARPQSGYAQPSNGQPSRGQARTGQARPGTGNRSPQGQANGRDRGPQAGHAQRSGYAGNGQARDRGRAAVGAARTGNGPAQSRRAAPAFGGYRQEVPALLRREKDAGEI
jgi:ATP-dependent RNA helicase RhlE